MKKHYFSPQNKGFYVEGINDDNLPNDAIEISQQEYDDIIDLQNSGKVIDVDSVTLKPVATEVIQSFSYQQLRVAEYPPMADYLDAVVKGDQLAIQAYIDKCLAVKAKYPKP